MSPRYAQKKGFTRSSRELIFVTSMPVASVGSLGKDGAYHTVEAVFVKNCTFNGTRNGARIKTWEVGAISIIS